MARSRRAVLRGIGSLVSLSGVVGCLGGESGYRTATFVHETADAQTGSPTTTPGQRYRLAGDGIRWGSLPVSFAVATNTVPDALDAQAAKAAIVASFETWNAVPNTEPVFESLAFDGDRSGVTAGNGVNELAWASLSGGEIGQTQLRWNTATNRFVEADVVLNADLPWSTNGNDTAFDVQNVLTHELGHNGLRDVTAAAQTMYYLSEPGETRKRSLESGDENGWQQLYGT